MRARLRSCGPRALFGVRLAASVCLALYITYALELQNSFWAATTAAIVCQPNLGTSLQKGRWRIIGTVAGALAMVTVLGLFAQSRYTLAFCLAAWCGACGVAVVVLRNFASYAAALAGFTAAVIFADTIADPTSAFFFSMVRVSEICIGIGSTLFVILLTDFGAARRTFAGLLEDLARQLVRGFRSTLAPPQDAREERVSPRDVLRKLSLFQAAADAAMADFPYLRSRSGHLRDAGARLMDAVLGWQKITLEQEASGQRGDTVRACLDTLLSRLDPADMGRDPERLRSACAEALQTLEVLPRDDAGASILADATRDLLLCLRETAGSIALLMGARAERRAAPWTIVIGDPLPPLLSGFRVFSAVAAAAAFTIATEWPNGPLAIAFVAIAVLIFAPAGDQARVLVTDYTIGSILVTVIGCGLYFGVMPSISTFPQLAVMLALFLVPVGWMQAGSWHTPLFLAMSVNLLPLIGVGNPISYDASTFFNIALTIILGNIIGTLFFIIIPGLSPEVRTRRLLALSVRDLRRLAGRPQTPDATRWTAVMTRRVEDLPPQATDEQAGSLLPLFVLGRALILLREAPASEADRLLISDASAALAEGRVELARFAFGGMERVLSERVASQPSETPAGLPSLVQIKIITDALDACSDLLEGTDSQRANPG
ncbi:FUSC family protein [Xanthobacter sp. 126]|uniref:FUSC family protein n=1 Tax=Xanthobacter sp. 126 TaxID=1131814 RepID=UPI0018CC2CEC|nr:FUSC family protein [Xanthobacter sp. 126]